MKKAKKLIATLFLVLIMAITLAGVTPKPVLAATKQVTVKFYDPIKKKVIKKEKVARGKTVKPPKAPKHKGYKFVKWSSKKYKKAKKNTTIKAVYKKRTYTVDFFDGITCEQLKSVRVKYNEPATPPKMDKIFTYNGKRYLFLGWDEKLNHVKDDMSVYSVVKELNGEADRWAERYLADSNGNIIIGTAPIRSGSAVKNHDLYNQLTTDEQRRVYREFVAYLESGEDLGLSFFDFGKDVSDGFAGVASAIEYEYFGQSNIGEWYDSCNYTSENYRKNLDTEKSIGNIANELLTYNKYLPTGACCITQRIASGVFINYICNKLSYKSGARYSLAAWNESAGNCQAYAKLYKVMCNTVGINCSLVYGYANGGYHMWNRVKLDGQWYYIDLCWIDSDNQFDGYYMYSKALWSDHELKKFDF